VVRCLVPAALLIASFSLIASQPVSARSKVKSVLPKPGMIVPDFRFTDFAGREHLLSDFHGHYVLMEFWATWCQPCVHEIPVLERARQLYQSRGLEILGLDSDGSLKKAQAFVAKDQIPWLQADPKSTKALIKKDLKIRWYPALILLDPQRTILFVSGNGGKPLTPDRLLKTLDQRLPPKFR
jgi:thiol-disulfide isomerase/thioredoxin